MRLLDGSPDGDTDSIIKGEPLVFGTIEGKGLKLFVGALEKTME